MPSACQNHWARSAHCGCTAGILPANCNLGTIAHSSRAKTASHLTSDFLFTSLPSNGDHNPRPRLETQSLDPPPPHYCSTASWLYCSMASLLHAGREGGVLAEREGFEPSVQVTPDNCLAGSPVRPLQHLSAVVAGPPILGTSTAESKHVRRRSVGRRLNPGYASAAPSWGRSFTTLQLPTRERRRDHEPSRPRQNSTTRPSIPFAFWPWTWSRRPTPDTPAHPWDRPPWPTPLDPPPAPRPGTPGWPNRDRFVLSCGHASALLYSLLHLSGYDCL